MKSAPWYYDVAQGPVGVTIVGLIALMILIYAARRLRETTLIAPVLWGCAAVAVNICAGCADGPFIRYAAAVLFVAPTLALLGAKRPQNGAWQFIVLTLVGVLLLPAFQGLAFGDDGPHVHALFRGLIAAHIVIGAVNYLPTGFALSAVLFSAAQACLAWQFLWGIKSEHALVGYASAEFAASVGLLCALILAIFQARRTAEPSPDRLWRDFRDAYGLVWGLRIAERLNASAQKHGWPVEFTWGGMLLREGTAELDPATQHRVERELRSHLRRFVSHDWIAARMPETRDVGTAP